MNKIKYLVSLIFILLVQNLSGQQFYTKNYTINNGLPDNHISAIFKDSHGYLWIGSKAGITRFDGSEFKTFTSLDGLAGNNVTSITEDKKGNLYIGCFDGGLSKYNGNQFLNLTQNDGLINNRINKLKYLANNQLLLIGTDDGFSVYDGNGIFSYHISLNNVKQRLDIVDFIEISNSVYLLTRSNGLYEFYPEARQLIKVIESNRLNNNSLFASYVTSTNDTLISFGRKGFKLINQSETLFENLGHVECFTNDNKNTIWIGSTTYGDPKDGGIYVLSNKKLIDYTYKLGINSRMVTALFFDDFENILWIGTADNGLFLFFGDTYSYYKANDFGVSNLEIKDIRIDKKDNLWILTNQHLIKRNPNKKTEVISLSLFKTQFNLFKNNELMDKYQYLLDPDGSFEKYELEILSNSYKYPNPYVQKRNNVKEILHPGSLYKPNKYDIILQKKTNEFTSITIDASDNIWLGANTGIFRFNSLTREINYIDLDDNFFTNFIFTPDNKLIASGWNNAIIYENIEKSTLGNDFSHYTHNSPANVTRAKTNKNQVWFLSTDHFLALYENNTFYLFDNPDSTNFQQLNDICFDTMGNIIAGGNEGKVFIMVLINHQLKVKHILSKLNGLSGTNIKWLTCTKDDILYIGTNTGINQINLDDLYSGKNIDAKIIDKSEGFIDYSGFISEIDKEGNSWIGANKELIRIDAANKYKTNNYRFYIKSITVNNEPIKFTQANLLEETPSEPIVLPWYKNSITFNLEIIKFSDPENIRFYYILKNGNQLITKDTKERYISFQNLNPGRYLFSLKTSSGFNENNADVQISFIIKKTFYKNWYAIIGFILLLFFIIWISIRWRTKRIQYQERRRLEVAEKIAELELKALRAQMNPHFIFNAINSIQNYMLSNDVDTALNYLSDFAKLIRITLDNVSKKFVTLEEELNYLKYYLSLEQMRFDKKFEIIINVPNEFDYNQILIPPMIIQPFIENSIKHGFANKIEKGLIRIDFIITTDNSGSDLHCLIEDNGIGRAKSQELRQNQTNKQKSRGTVITKERFALLNQTHPRKGYKIETTDLYNQNNDTCGTRVDITFPI
ncbi:MAG: hypothetical protein A2W99_03135 [Bacteroidetes bacterium GWF2_33_16]|nr:MAG: hypothetical protein A2X00_09880 [Bacteroidetes bacterium GWE2_32_14]OFY07889.1 MAG: hypothetical protein A2W99_03135 [Bacteroidetes bacterium GWF2_33_16]